MISMVLNWAQTFCIAGAVTCVAGLCMLVYHLLAGKEF
jgi:hypothetical protein